MKKPYLFIAIIILVLIVLVIYTKKPKLSEENKVDETPVVVTEKTIVPDSYQTKVLNPNDAYVKVDIKYPSFKNADKNFNLKIEKLLKDTMAEHLKASKENWQARYDTQLPGDNITKVPSGDQDKFTFYSDFTIVQSNSSYISFVLKYGGFSGGAHGYENNASFNFDVKNQKELALKDLFPNDPQYLTYLSTKSRESLTKTFATVTDADRENSEPRALEDYVKNIKESINTGTEPKEENFGVFTFTNEKVKIYFGQYQVGPYTFGSPEVEIVRK